LTDGMAGSALIDDLAQRLNESNDRLLALFDLVSVEVRSLDASERIQRIISVAQRLLDADAIAVSGPFPVSTGRVNPDGYCHSEFPDVHDGPAIRVDVGRSSSPFLSPEKKLIGAMSSLISNSVRSHQLHEQMVAQEVVGREHELAAQLAQGVLPSAGDTPSVDGLNVFGETRPAKSAGGDLFTWALVDGGLGFAVGDVSGKGLPAAVLMSTVVNAVNEAFRNQPAAGPETVMEVVNRWVWRLLSEAGMFVTLIIGRFDLATHTVSLVNAGHSPAVFQLPPGEADGGPARRVHATAPPVGILADISPNVWSTRMDEGSVLVVGSDGLTEQMDRHDVMFGEERFDRLVSQVSPVPTAAELGRRIFAAVDLHAGATTQGDDRTLVVLRRGLTHAKRS